MEKKVKPVDKQAKRVSLVTFSTIADKARANAFAVKRGIGLGTLLRVLLFREMNNEG